MNIGENLQKLRLTKTNLTQKELSKELGIPYSTYVKYEQGNIKTIETTRLEKIKEYFNCSYDDILK